MNIVNFREVPLATQLLIPTTTEHPWKPSARPLNQPDPGHQQPLSLSQFDTKAGSLGLGCWGKSWRNSLLQRNHHFKTKRLPVALSVRENYYQSSWSCSIISQGKNIFHLKCKVNCQVKLYPRYIEGQNSYRWWSRDCWHTLHLENLQWRTHWTLKHIIIREHNN